MEYVDEGDRIVARLDPGEGVIESLEALRETAEVTGGFFFGIGAVDQVTLGHYDVDEEDYKEERIEEQLEVTSFQGNIGPDKIHAHIQLADRAFDSVGGHCAGARVSGTFEIAVFRGETILTHHLDHSTGLDVFDI
ncbi:MAG: PPC domain-containing DNA-binding protein [Halodesulfurarchaeum sp.]